MKSENEYNFFNLLVCPETKDELIVANEEELKKINNLIASKTVLKKDGTIVNKEIKEALIRTDRKIAYEVVDGIPILLIDEGICIQ